ncbi:MAG TPA: Lrp/AsnC ligand binding domain-containing protein [Nitrososphaerales archaeon]|nr:Lrp/AsnC ligand binding domain-containing protein [Nitrososphaerales archaeon]
MPKALVLITVDSGTDPEVVKELKGVSSVKEIYEVYGAYDIIAMVEGDSNARIKETVFNNIRRLDHVKSTLTMMIVED